MIRRRPRPRWWWPKGAATRRGRSANWRRNGALPVLEYPPLARALYFTTRERQMIREELYTAVAAIVAFVLSVRRGEPAPRPLVSLPVELQFDAEGRPGA